VKKACPNLPPGKRKPLEECRNSAKEKELSREEALRRVARALDEIQYGEVIVKIQAGRVMWVDKHERERVG